MGMPNLDFGTTEWESTIDGKPYEFSHRKTRGRHELTVNGIEQIVKGSFLSAFTGSVDGGFDLDGREARLVVQKGVPDVAVDGVYLRSGKPYVRFPAWAYPFVIACLPIPFLSIGHTLPVFAGVCGAYLCAYISKTPLKAAARMALCAAVCILAWFLWFFEFS